jgi:hypothetical protein
MRMAEAYIDLGNIDHLNLQAKGGGVYDDRMWRESYYFNMTDPASGITLITTIGRLPNRNRDTGFVLLFRNGRPVLLKPLVEFQKPLSSKYSFSLRGLEFSVEGAGWNLRYSSDKCSFDLTFTPLNKLFTYIVDENDRMFQRIGTQHYEQSGTYEGVLTLRGETVNIGPCFGHRDHSWGIRDWSGVDWYRLFCCAFSSELAVNLWEGEMDGRPFIKGYVFDGKRNNRIARSAVETRFRKDGRTPKAATVDIED